MDDGHPWVDANPKETDITYLRVGQKVTVDIDTFPNHTFHGTVAAISPGTGAQFAILPPQNASGNWVKVVQRVPVRIVFDPDEDVSLLRSGMSANVAIDTGRRRSLASMLGMASVAQEQVQAAHQDAAARQATTQPGAAPQRAGAAAARQSGAAQASETGGGRTLRLQRGVRHRHTRESDRDH